MKFSGSALIATLFLASSAVARKYTTTLDVDDGNTLVLSEHTNANGATVTSTISTINGDDDDTSTSTTTTAGRDTTTERIVASTTSNAPMRTTTYWVDTGNGHWTYYTWTAPTTTVPTVATANVAQGSVANYEAYQSSINAAVYSSAAAENDGHKRAQPVGMDGVFGAWMTLAVGAVGAGLGVLAL
ncbi:hypothetical protein L202_00146 [Cryptococcus amylolentus CBS 6039]|uniref:Uncharacterized protein n=1 Tax=Cryptococcus amylolentus CBS 6039 TaxID=1295533 RepID=A0A1E3I6L9_9TREE|nr:hypothetical protein L202_00146 [Cryptococcus amylolentus CBS 6039]ODN84138.1 hypothetical protein L202_00146 [Cryptococcus amylolentus CBS 6039]